MKANEKRQIVLIGGGGHAKSVIGLLLSIGGWEIAGYTDTSADCACREVPELKHLGDESRLPEVLDRGAHFAVMGIGSTGREIERRHQIFRKVKEMGFLFPVLVSPHAVVDRMAVLGEGTVVMPGAIVNPWARTGENCILNTGAILEHDCLLGDNVHLATGVKTAGRVTVGDHTHVGTGASVIQGIRIGSRALVGAGSVVIRPVGDGKAVWGVPAKEREK